MEFINDHKKSDEKGEAIEKRNKELEEELEHCNEKLKRLRKEDDELQENKSCEDRMLQEDIARFKAEIKEYKQKIANKEHYYDTMRARQVDTVEKNANQILNEKAPVVGSVKSILKAKEIMVKNTQTMRMNQKAMEEKMYNTMTQFNIKHYDKEKNQLVLKYNSLIEEQKKDYDRYVDIYQ